MKSLASLKIPISTNQMTVEVRKEKKLTGIVRKKMNRKSIDCTRHRVARTM